MNPKINRHTGKPHEHKREIARRKRQARVWSKEELLPPELIPDMLDYN